MVIGRRAASRGYAAPHSRQHPQSGGGAPQPRPQRGSAPGAAVAAANPARPAQEAGPHPGSTRDAQRGFTARSAQPQAHPVPDSSSSSAPSASGGAGRNAGARVRSRREGPSIPRGADRTLQSPHVAGARSPEAVARRQSFDGQGAHASSDRVDCADRAAEASRSHAGATRVAAPAGPACSDAGALARSASGASAVASPSGERAASEEARRAAERAARQQRMAERRRQAAMAQSRSAEEGAASVRTSSTRVAPSREAERQTSRAASPDSSARSSEASRPSAIRAKTERSGAPAHARHAR